MDEKTLEYMGQRVDRARKIKQTLIGVKRLQEVMETANHTGVRFDGGRGKDVSLGEYHGDPSTNVAVSECQKAAINALVGLKNDLEKELDEL